MAAVVGAVSNAGDGFKVISVGDFLYREVQIESGCRGVEG